MSRVNMRVWCSYFGNFKREVDYKQRSGRPSACRADACNREDKYIKMAVIARDLDTSLGSAHSTVLE